MPRDLNSNVGAGTKTKKAQPFTGLYIRQESDITQKGYIQYDRWQQGLAGTGPYGYYRIGQSASLNNPAIYGWLSPNQNYTVISENTIFDAKASRDIYKLAGGQMARAPAWPGQVQGVAAAQARGRVRVG